MSAPDRVRAVSEQLSAWLANAALPLWWERGADRETGGFVDRLSLEGWPATGARRVRVQARQAFVYGRAHAGGWDGPALEAHRHGLAALRALRDPDGLHRSRPAPAGDFDGMGLVYDQAFALLALSAARGACGDAAAEAEGAALADALAPFAQPLGGYGEVPGVAEPLFANPNMHLFEAFQAWAAASDAPRWRKLAAMERDLAAERLIEPGRGVLGERFGPGWSAPLRSEDRIVWPGHLYEWAFLLMTWDTADLPLALRLIEVAETKGVDLKSGLAWFALDAELRPLDRGGRLWAQAERLRACAAAAAQTGDAALWDAALQAAGVLESFLQMNVRGLWRDRLEASGAFVDEAAPASSLYHLAGAIDGLAASVAAG